MNNIYGMNLRIYDLYTTWPYKISDLNIYIDFLLDFPETIHNFKANGDVRALYNYIYGQAKLCINHCVFNKNNHCNIEFIPINF